MIRVIRRRPCEAAGSLDFNVFENVLQGALDDVFFFDVASFSDGALREATGESESGESEEKKLERRGHGRILTRGGRVCEVDFCDSVLKAGAAAL